MPMMNPIICCLSKFFFAYFSLKAVAEHVFYSGRHVEPSAVQNARSLALSLVGTLQQDFIQWQREQQALQQQQLVYTFSQPYFGG